MVSELSGSTYSGRDCVGLNSAWRKSRNLALTPDTSANTWYSEEARGHYLTRLRALDYLPASSCSAVEREGVTDPRVDVIQTQLSLWSRAYCHCDECGITVWWLPLGVWWRGG